MCVMTSFATGGQILLSCLFVASTTGAAIHKSKHAGNSLEQLHCLALSDGNRLGFHDENNSFMSDKLVNVGESVELQCHVTGAPQATIRWKHNGLFLDQERAGYNLELIENINMPFIGIGTTVSTLVIDCVDSESAGLYSCVAENSCSEAIEMSATVAIRESEENEKLNCRLPSITAGVAPRINFWTDARLEQPEATVILFCRATGHPQPTIEWFEEGDGDEYHKIKNDTSHLLLDNGDLQLRGQNNKPPSVGYKCTATNVNGSDSIETIVIHVTVSLIR